MVIVLGLNAFHGDASACILRDGVLIAAAEEERFRRIKHWAGFPAQATGYCLEEAGVRLADVDHVAVNSDPRANFGRKVIYAALKRPDIKLAFDRLKNQRKRISIERELTDAFPGQTFDGAVHRVEHHLAHLASAFLVSPFDRAAVVSVDGFGDFSSSAWGVGEGGDMDVLGRVYFPHSLGVFYQAITQHIGFPHYGDEYKVMGLAPYGQPKMLDAMRRIVTLQHDGSFALDLQYFRHHREKIAYAWEGGAPSVGALFSPALEDLLGPARKRDEALTQRHMDIAHSAQAMYEEAFFHLLNKLHARCGAEAVALAGGCAMNSVANGKVARRTPFRKIYVQAAAGDAGGAIGAAMQVWRAQGGARTFQMRHAYWGPHYGGAAIAETIAGEAKRLQDADCLIETLDEPTLLARTADAIAAGEVVGWFQGRMEWGPRALGNRSILGDPRRADMKDILNIKIKRRESFRPFAPSVLSEAVDAWFEEDGEAPFMMQVYQIRAEKRPVIPAVTHVDGSGRLQSVHADTNPRYHRLITAFAARTNVPMVLNTSFNESEPIVTHPREALDCFLRTNMDVLVLGETMIRRKR
ncbi:MAG: carbamoyltransferase [Hyphomicrobiales bacterium]|nr:carbamoyltransferase [Hyphomicrobiales bacterium]